MRKTSFKFYYGKIVAFVFLVIGFLLPIIVMFINVGKVDVSQIILSPQFKQATYNSLAVATVATLIAVLLAGVLAWTITRTNIKCKSLFCLLLTIPMLIPSISHGMGLVMLFGSNGVLTNLLHLNTSIYGFVGIVVGSVMYSFPLAFLMICDVLIYEDYSTYEAANVLGISKFRQLRDITFPYMRKPLISIVFAVFTMNITDYGVPLMVGGKCMTLPILMYQEVIGLLDFGKGSVIGVVLMIPAAVAFALDVWSSDKTMSSFITMTIEIPLNRIRDILSYIINTLSALLVLLPIMAFVFLTFVKKYPIDLTITFDNILNTFNMGGGRYLLNSVLISILVSALGTIIAYFTAYITARTKGKMSRLLHLIAITSLAVPGLVLGLSYAMFFSKTFIYGTIVILILVNTIHFFASPYLMAYNSFHKINENLEAVGTTLGINRFFLMKDVFIPQMRSTILEMISYFFVNSMITISAVSFLITVKNMPISLMITQFESQMMLECSAFVSLLILLINAVVKGVVFSLNHFRKQ